MPARFEPNVQVIGIFAPTRPPGRLERFISEELERLGDDFPAARRAEIGAELRAHLAEAVLFEVVATYCDATFDVGGFTQPDPGVSSERWQVAWAEVYLTADGEELACPRWSVPPDQRELRIAFWLHFFNQSLPLRTPYGELPCTAVQPMPERLWRIAPYELPD